MAETSQITYNQQIRLFKQFADNHLFLKSFDNGQQSDIVENNDATDRIYPLMFVIDGPATFDTGELSNNYLFLFMDIVHQNAQGQRTENEIKSDMLQIAQDFLAYLSVNPALNGLALSFVLEEGSTGNTFVERAEDNLTGWGFDITIRQPIDYNNCKIPQ